ncbi:hypothetical protein SB912_30205, partial [Pantoea sp. SIMBA_072]
MTGIARLEYWQKCQVSPRDCSMDHNAVQWRHCLMPKDTSVTNAFQNYHLQLLEHVRSILVALENAE